ncbi:MAG: acyl-CoA thioesterase [Campylobacterales bacterium]|nr:acyl-CoA thioesterase [Campylobacterales bacterium]
MKELALRGRAYPSDLNHNGNVFGGFIMAKMDKAASIAVDGVVRCGAVTVSVSDLVFKKPVHNGDIFTVYTEIKKVGKTSITVFVDVEVRNHVSGIEYTVTEAEFKFVTVDEVGNSVPVQDVMRPNLSKGLMKLIKEGAKAAEAKEK